MDGSCCFKLTSNINSIKSINFLKLGENGFRLVAQNLSKLIETALFEIENKDEYVLVTAACCLSGGGSKLAQDKLYAEFSNLSLQYQVYVTNFNILFIIILFDFLKRK